LLNVFLLINSLSTIKSDYMSLLDNSYVNK
jgi:hypothetical protein